MKNVLISTWQKANKILDHVAESAKDPFLLCIRLYWGWQFFMTGKGKLGNLDGVTEFFTDLGLPLPKLQAIMAGSTECFGGLLLLVGIASRWVSLPLIFVMLVAYATAHRDVVVGIFEDSDAFVTAPPFLFLMAALIIFIFGPGKLSVDGLLQNRKKGATN